MAWAPDYCTTDELKAYRRIEDSADNAQVALAISAASRAIDKSCNRQFGLAAAPVARYYTAEYDIKRRAYTVAIDDLMTEVGLVIGYDDLNDFSYSGAVTDYTLAPLNADAEERPWTSLIVRAGVGAGQDRVKVTAQWGWTEVPPAIKQACLMQASRLLQRRDSPYGVAGSPDMGNEMRLLAKIDPDVAVTIRSYYRWWGAV